ncbi:hypothetical protein BC938DRAFT_476627, partial [Jimgerdemannia flammicorona]
MSLVTALGGYRLEHIGHASGWTCHCYKSVTRCSLPLTTVHCRSPPLTAAHCRSPPLATAHHRSPLLAATRRRSAPLTATRRLVSRTCQLVRLRTAPSRRSSGRI